VSELSIIPAMAVAFAVTVAFMVGLRPLAKGIGLVDRPGGRKNHLGDVPIIGGLAMFIGVLSGLAIADIPAGVTTNLIVASLLLISIGALDDRYQVPPIVRMLIQVAAILVMAYGANQALASIGNPFGFGEILLGPFTLLGTLIVSATVVNAYNLVDGVDGLSGTLASIALVAVAIVGGAAAPSTGIALSVLAAILGFMMFNFPVVLNRPIRSFMGDTGSTFLGFVIVWVTLGVSQGSEAVISPVAALWFASIPVYDSLTCFVRRIMARKSPFKPGRDHFHHTLKRGGFSARQTLAILGGLQALYATVGIVGLFAGIHDFILFAAWCVLGLTQRLVIQKISTWHRSYIMRMYREGRLGPNRAARARALQ
jgi:UDP-GlcNAc:undecaprenyl-phosphate GlcNAc-1-phosphate transferase